MKIPEALAAGVVRGHQQGQERADGARQAVQHLSQLSSVLVRAQALERRPRLGRQMLQRLLKRARQKEYETSETK